MIEPKLSGETEKMWRASGIAAEGLAVLRGLMRPGVTTGEFDRVAEEMTKKREGRKHVEGHAFSVVREFVGHGIG